MPAFLALLFLTNNSSKLSTIWTAWLRKCCENIILFTCNSVSHYSATGTYGIIRALEKAWCVRYNSKVKWLGNWGGWMLILPLARASRIHIAFSLSAFPNAITTSTFFMHSTAMTNCFLTVAPDLVCKRHVCLCQQTNNSH